MTRAPQAKEIVLCHSSLRGNAVFRCLETDAFPVRWIFLGQDYRSQLNWEARVPGTVERLLVGALLEETARELGGAFRDFIGQMSRENASPAWWSSRVSEKNTLVSPLFLYCCYLAVFVDLIKSVDGILFVVAEDYSLLAALKTAAQEAGVPVRMVGAQILLSRGLFEPVFVAGRIIKFFLRSWQARAAGNACLSVSGRKLVLIHTYIDEGCFKPDGSFFDRYFTGVAVWLEQQGREVVTLPVFFNVKRTAAAGWDYLRKTGKNFINPYVFYKLSDYIFVLQESWRQRAMPREVSRLSGMNVAALFSGERRRFSFATLDSLLYVRLPLRLKEAGVRIDQVLAPFENMVDEKMLVAGLRQDMSATTVVGYQHSSLYQHILCQYISAAESAVVPLPDRVVCNGGFHRDVFIRQGYAPGMLVVGPALRYAHLWKNAPSGQVDGNTCDVLVPLPLMEGDALELLVKAVKAFRENPGIRVAVKLHPMMPEAVFFQKYFSDGLPNNFFIMRVSMDQAIVLSKVALAMSSGTVLEMIAAGLPVVVVGRDAVFDLIPFAFYEVSNRVFRSPQDIREEVLRLMNSDQLRLAEARRGQRIVKAVFSPVSESAMGAFLCTSGRRGM